MNSGKSILEDEMKKDKLSLTQKQIDESSAFFNSDQWKKIVSASEDNAITNDDNPFVLNGFDENENEFLELCSGFPIKKEND